MLELIDVTKRYGDTVAVNGITLRIGSGEFFALLGPNAAGKTTTVKMIAGLLRPTSGQLTIAGHDCACDGIRARSILGFVPDIPFLYDKLTVAETLDFAACVYELPVEERERAREEMLSLFPLARERDLLVEQLSHGLRQRLVFSMAMIHRPRLMVVDEPFVGLDPRSMRTVKDVLKDCARGGGAVFMSTHTLSAAEELADRIGIIMGGRIIALGSPGELKQQAGGAHQLEEAFLQITEEDAGS